MKNYYSKMLLLLVFNQFSSCTVTSVNPSIANNLIKNSNDTSRTLASFTNDSIAYINYIVANKKNYVGKPLMVFLNDLDLKVSNFAASPMNKTESGSIFLIFQEWEVYSKRVGSQSNQPIEIMISWEKPLTIESIKVIKEQNKSILLNPNSWSYYAKDYFENIKVGNTGIPYYLQK